LGGIKNIVREGIIDKSDELDEEEDELCEKVSPKRLAEELRKILRSPYVYFPISLHL
jgi:hypothetical protein